MVEHAGQMSVLGYHREATVARQADDGVPHGGVGPEHPAHRQHHILDPEQKLAGLDSRQGAVPRTAPG